MMWDWPWIFSCLALGSTGFIVLPMVITDGREPVGFLLRLLRGKR
jgi:hypothetical protein